MKVLAVALLLFVGCYQPSAAERYNAESEALDRVEKDMEPLNVLKRLIDSGEANEANAKLWEDRKADYEELESIRKAQLERVRESRRQLRN